MGFLIFIKKTYITNDFFNEKQNWKLSNIISFRIFLYKSIPVFADNSLYTNLFHKRFSIIQIKTVKIDVYQM